MFLKTLKTKLINKHFKFLLTIQYETCSSNAEYCSSSIYLHSGEFEVDLMLQGTNCWEYNSK